MKTFFTIVYTGSSIVYKSEQQCLLASALGLFSHNCKIGFCFWGLRYWCVNVDWLDEFLREGKEKRPPKKERF